MLLSRLRIRGKLGLLSAVPLLAVIALAVPVVNQRVDTAGRAALAAARASLAADVGQLIQALQQERLVLLGVGVGAAPRAQLQAQVELVERRAAALRTRDLPDGVALAPALDAVGGYAPRHAAPAAADPRAVVPGYGGLIGGLIDALGLRAGTDGGTGRQLYALDAALRTDEALAVAGVYAFLLGVPRYDHLLARYHGAQAVFAADVDRFRHFATPAQQTLYTRVARVGEVVTTEPGVDPRPALRAQALPDLLRALYYRGSADRVVSEQIVGDVTALADRDYRAQVLGAILVGVGVLLLTVFVVGFCLVVGRRVVRPLTRLTASAERIAAITEDELLRVVDDEVEAARPVRLDPVATDAPDEIGELARAIEGVQRTAVSLVHRQVAVRRNIAQMFHHVGRRTQALVARQTIGIETLTGAETDPVRRADLTRLLQLTGRLRRNAGSLVVISGAVGTEPPTEPRALRDIVRLALAEIEDGDRVDIEVPAALAVVPALAGDAVLLLAELVENACVYSPPTSRVTVAAEETRAGARVRITDAGIGLSEGQLTTENSRLRQRERLDLAPTGALGLFVVGRLARRHRLRVGLTADPGGGTTAIIELPARLLADDVPPRVAVPGPAPPRRPGAALDRARAAVTEGPSWSGFIPLQRPAAEPWAPRYENSEEAPVFPATAAPRPIPLPAAPAQRAGDDGLIRRIPGATLPARARAVGVQPAPAGAPTHDPAAVRALVEEFESGVARAMDEYGPASGEVRR
ncbi:histidine kinase [Pilimelia anulata]|uniref:histidine kinase n=1 Tax=Pilimelia anulata TaxID=53371 RepID=A0A8J3BFY5_9ACTN|nr:histidine kinase [Pilimelia anulata]